MSKNRVSYFSLLRLVGVSGVELIVGVFFVVNGRASLVSLRRFVGVGSEDGL